MSENEDKGCGEEGHVCVCSTESTESKETHVISESLEDWIIHELGRTKELLEMPGREMFDVIFGRMLTFHTCLLCVKITSRHDEIAAAYKKALLDLKHASRRSKQRRDRVWFEMYLSLGVFQLLELGKAGKTVADDDQWNDRWFEINTNEDKLKAVMKEVYGE